MPTRVAGSRRGARRRSLKLSASSLPALRAAYRAGRLPAAAEIRAGGARLRGRLAGVLALVQAPLEQRGEEDDQREQRDHAEAEVRHDLVVGLAPPALSVVVLGVGE